MKLQVGSRFIAIQNSLGFKKSVVHIIKSNDDVSDLYGDNNWWYNRDGLVYGFENSEFHPQFLRWCSTIEEIFYKEKS